MKIKARQAFENRQLWDEIEAGKKYLIWRIGHVPHVVTWLFEVNGKLRADLKEDGRRPIKSGAVLDVRWNHHPVYQDFANQVLTLVQASVPSPVTVFEKPEGLYRFEIAEAAGTRGAECDGEMFEKRTPEQVAALITESLTRVLW